MTGESLYPRDLIERLRGALDERERVAIAAAQTNGNRWEREWAFSTHFVVPADVEGSTAAVNVSRLKPSQRAAAEHIAANDPAFVLRTIQAHGAIIRLYTNALGAVEHWSPYTPQRNKEQDEAAVSVLEGAVEALASIYFPESVAQRG